MKAFYCVGTHWDREWYEPFQEFRRWLVELVDEVMDLMEQSPEYRCFHLDGQAVVLQDYLEIRPENRERLVSMLKSGRLLAGPWYDLPDEWLISGESFVRNLMMGMTVCRELGFEPMSFAYTPDQFGHIAALPMIMGGFGLKAGICWRGAQDETYPAQFVWVGPDGSRMVTHKLIDRGSYANFDFLFRTHVKETGITDKLFTEYFEPFIKAESERAKTDLILMLDAIDHQRPDHDMPALMAEMKRRYPDIEFEWTSLAEYGKEMLRRIDQLPERYGELREPARDVSRGGQYLIVHTISSRYPVKQRNDQCQAMLEKWAEPYALFEKMCGATPLPSYLNKAWEYLLRNSPHDSICGCSVDQVHRDMRYRFDQAELLADGIVRRAMAKVAGASDAPEAQRNVVIHNPLPQSGKRVVDLALAFPLDWTPRYLDGLCTAESLNKFVLTDVNGVNVPFQLSRIERNVEHKVLRDNGRKTARSYDVYHLAVELDLPACGYTGVQVEPSDEATRNFGSQLTGPLSASNGLIDLSINGNGSARLTAGDSLYDNLFIYEDCGDAGDGWTMGRLLNDIVYRTPGSRVTTGIEEDGPFRTTFRIDREFDLPPCMDRKTNSRVTERTILRVTDHLILEKNAPYVRVRTHLEHNIKDHRFRVLFPTYKAAQTSFAETPFAVVERDIAVPPETAHWHERINPEKAFTSFFGVQDTQGGLAILAPYGLHEYEVLQSSDHSLALTLLRATFKTYLTPEEPDGELQGPLDYEYLIYPFTGAFDPVHALNLLARHQAPIRMHYATQLPHSRSFLHLKNNSAIITTIKPSADNTGGVIRLWNPSTETVCDELIFDIALQSAILTTLDERPGEAISMNGCSVPVTIPPQALTTVKITF